MKIKLYLILLSIFAGTNFLLAQEDLKKLRAEPDTNIVTEREKRPLGIKNINVPIPRLGLSVNYWKHWTRVGANINQAAFSDNWSSGAVNSLSWMLLGWHKSEYNKNNFSFLSEIDLKYGKIQNKDQLAKKNNDRIFWDNKLSYRFAKSWAVYASISLESQFDVGYSYGRDPSTGRDTIRDIISNFMAPGRLTESFGLEYKPDNSFWLRLGTGTARQTIILDKDLQPTEQSGPRFGVEPGKKTLNELAFQVTANLDKNLSKNLNIKSRYNLFADYKDLKDPNHRLEATLSAKVSNLVTVTLNGVLNYDKNFIWNDEEKARIQYSQSLALGLVYNLPR